MHPLVLLDGDDLGLLEIWREWRGGGFGRGPLPFAGGIAEQPACVMASLAIMEGAYQKLRPPRTEG